MKPIESHKDSRITNISFDNFTGSISIITPLSDNDEDDDPTKDLMLSTPQANAGGNLFQPNQHVALITQPILGARSRKKNGNDSLANSRRSSLNETPSLTSSNNRLEKFLSEKRTSHSESIDSGLDFSLSTNSSIQHSQQQQPPPHIANHRPLSALNEDSNVDEGFQDQSTRLPVVNPGDLTSKENFNHNHTNAVVHDFEKSTKKCNDASSSTPSIQQHLPSNDLTNLTKSKKSSRKKTKLNIIVEPSVSFSSSTRLTIHDESLQPKTRPNLQPMKPKAITPLGHYPNPEQIRAHINRSVIERQHPPYLANLSRKSFLQSHQQHDTSSMSTSKPKHFSFRQQKQSSETFFSLISDDQSSRKENFVVDRNSQGEISTTQHFHITPSYRTKQILPDLHHEDIIDNYREKKHLNKWQENTPKDLLPGRNNSRNPVKTNQQEFGDTFLTSTPRLHHHLLNAPQRFKPTAQIFQHKNRTTKSNVDFPHEHFSRNGNIPLQSQPKKVRRASNIGFAIEQYHPFNQRQKSPTESMNSSFRSNRNQTLEINTNRLTKVNQIPIKSHRFFPARSPVTMTLTPDQHSYQSSLSSTPNDFLDDLFPRTNQLTSADDQKLLDGRYVIPSHHSLHPSCIYSSSHPFSSISRLTIANDTTNHEELINRPNCFSSPSLDLLSPTQQYSFPLGKVTVEIENDDISTNYDSDDGWSNDSAELIYVDERYRPQKKKNINSSSSQVLAQQSLTHHHLQQQNLLLR